MILVVPTERHVERALREGGSHEPAETRASLRRRLLRALAPDVVLVGPEETRVALATALPAIARRDALLAPLVLRDGGAGAWLRTVDAVDDALGVLFASGVEEAALAAVERASHGAVKRRARLLHDAMVSLVAVLARAGLHDGRTAGLVLAAAIADADPERVCDAVGSARVIAKWIVTWEPSDVAWWRVLDVALSRCGGGATIELPAVDYALDAERKATPLERILDDLARGLDEAPSTSVIDTPLGDMRMTGQLADPSRVEIREAADARGQGLAVADAVRASLAAARLPSSASSVSSTGSTPRAQLELGFTSARAASPVETIAVALPRFDDETLESIREALDDARIPAYVSRGPAPTSSRAVSLALDALALSARGLPRRELAALLRSGYVDASALLGTRRVGAQGDLARALDETPTVRAGDDVSAIEATARAWSTRSDDEAGVAREERARMARALGQELSLVTEAKTRLEHAAAARRLWAALGIESRVVAVSSEAFSTDAPAKGIARAELHAVAREARAWEVLLATLERYERAVVRVGAGGAPASGDEFRHELARALEAGAAQPGAARAGAVRIARVEELAGEELDLLVVADANEGVLPQSATGDPLLPEALTDALRERSPERAPSSAQLRAARELSSLMAAAACAKKVVLCYRVRDESGAALAAAPLVAWLERARAAKVRVSAAPASSAPLTTQDAMLSALALASPERAEALAPESFRRARIERAREAFFETENAAASEITGRLAADDQIRRVLTAETGGGDGALSVTGLERIATCAFQGFAAVVLRAEGSRGADDEPDAREAGILLHDALAAAFRATAMMWRVRPRDRAGIARAALAAGDKVLRREAAMSGLRQLAIDRLRDSIAAVVTFSLDDEEWDFALAEQPFGDGKRSSWPLLRIDADDGQSLALRGSIDRVDFAHGAVEVRAIDYKSSDRAALRATKGLGETTFQIAMYAKIAAAQRGAPEASAQGLYLPANAAALPMKQRRLVASAKSWAQAHEPIEGKPRGEAWAMEAVRAFRGGGIAPVPIEKDACERCSFDGGCRKPRFVIRGTAPEEGPSP